MTAPQDGPRARSAADSGALALADADRRASAPAQQDLYEMTRPVALAPLRRLDVGPAGRPHRPTTTSTSPTTGSRAGHPLNQSLYVGYKVMLAGLLMLAKGDRVAMNSSVETRYPFLDEDVVDFCAGIAPEYKLQGLDREVAPAPGGGADPAAEDRQPAQDDVPRQHVGDLPRAQAGRPGSTSSSAPSRSAPPASSIPRHDRRGPDSRGPDSRGSRRGDSCSTWA